MRARSSVVISTARVDFQGPHRGGRIELVGSFAHIPIPPRSFIRLDIAGNTAWLRVKPLRGSRERLGVSSREHGARFAW